MASGRRRPCLPAWPRRCRRRWRGERSRPRRSRTKPPRADPPGWHPLRPPGWPRRPAAARRRPGRCPGPAPCRARRASGAPTARPTLAAAAAAAMCSSSLTTGRPSASAASSLLGLRPNGRAARPAASASPLVSRMAHRAASLHRSDQFRVEAGGGAGRQAPTERPQVAGRGRLRHQGVQRGQLLGTDRGPRFVDLGVDARRLIQQRKVLPGLAGRLDEPCVEAFGGQPERASRFRWRRPGNRWGCWRCPGRPAHARR